LSTRASNSSERLRALEPAPSPALSPVAAGSGGLFARGLSGTATGRMASLLTGVRRVRLCCLLGMGIDDFTLLLLRDCNNFCAYSKHSFMLTRSRPLERRTYLKRSQKLLWNISGKVAAENALAVNWPLLDHLCQRFASKGLHFGLHVYGHTVCYRI
jgi:hypothetical protein